MTESPFEVSSPGETGVKHNGADPYVSFASQRWRTLKEQLAGLEQVARDKSQDCSSLPLIHYCVLACVLSSALFLSRLRDMQRTVANLCEIGHRDAPLETRQAIDSISKSRGGIREPSNRDPIPRRDNVRIRAESD